MFENSTAHARTSTHEAAIECLTASIEAAHPATVIDEHVTYDSTQDALAIAGQTYDLSDVTDVVVVGGGNAAGAIAQALENALGSRLTDGIVITDAPQETATVETLLGDHPVPSDRGVANTRRMRARAADADESDLVIAVIGGGGSALMAAPVDAVPLAALSELTDALLESGASIDEINAVRKHLSTLKGGQLAQEAAPARVVGLVFSDVVGDDLSVIASGPTAPDATTYEDALTVLDRYDISAPDSVQTYLERGSAEEVPDTPDSASDVFDRVDNHVLANGMTAVEAAATAARDNAFEPVILSSRMRGEAREIATAHMAIAEECLASGQPVDPPAVLLSGGETTVTVRGSGTGGPNQEFAVSGALDIPDGMVLGSVDTDGYDGSTDAAGALVDSETITTDDRAERTLDDNDAYSLLDDHDALLQTGETGTNVNDLRVLVIPD